ncbi:Bifunctional inhibitor/plant lipid transfer protein/seed storage helical domain [Dillenia turbinata]|uniref:Bifunctional inhibitor/plant lipid transfer protein/seed storage helical domain n=1 Tax=Dillenia turbinata TaxID=194707 RepID=A0AAN8UBR3_9MAGN
METVMNMHFPANFSPNFLLLTLLTSTIIIGISAASLPSQPPPPPPPPSLSGAGGCSDKLVAFSPCLPYVSLPPNSIMPSPSWQCCNIFAANLESGDSECLCYLLIQPLILGFPLNTTRLISLSSLCQWRNLTSSGSLESLCSGDSSTVPTSSPPTPSKQQKIRSFFFALSSIMLQMLKFCPNIAVYRITLGIHLTGAAISSPASASMPPNKAEVETTVETMPGREPLRNSPGEHLIFSCNNKLVHSFATFCLGLISTASHI